MEQLEGCYGCRSLARRVTEADATVAALQAALDSERAQSLRHVEEAMNLRAQLTQRTAECDALKLVNDTHMKTVMKLSHVVEQRTAELEAAQHDAEVYRKMHAVASMERNILSNERADLQAELERVSLLSSHNERRFEEVDKKYKELRTLVLALPKVEGEIVAQAGYVKDRKKVYACFGSDADMTAYAAIVQHRQGMEG